MSDTPETDRNQAQNFEVCEFICESWNYVVPADFARNLELRLNEAIGERDEAKREVAEILSCIKQAIDSNKRHERMSSVWLLVNLLSEINKRRKHE